MWKICKSNCPPGTVWIVISSTSALPAALWSATFRYKSLIRVERELQENQTNQTKEGGSWAIRRARLKCQVWQPQAWPGALGVERLLPCCWARAFPSSARAWNPQGCRETSESGWKSPFVLQCCQHLHWTLQPERQHWQWPPTVDYFCSSSAQDAHGLCTGEHETTACLCMDLIELANLFYPHSHCI